MRGFVLGLCALLACGGDDDATGGGADGASDRCRPSGGGPHWVTEGEAVAFDLSCELGLDLGAGAFALDPVPDGAAFDADAGRFEWTPGLDQAAVYRIAIEASELGETGEVVIGVADAWDTEGNVPVVDPVQYPLEYGLPVLFLSPPPEAEEPYVPVTVVYGGVEYSAEGKLRGASSLDYPKKSYILKFDGQRFGDPDSDGGFLNKRRIVLTSTFDDNSYIRQWLAFELWSRLEPTIEVQSYVAVVYQGGTYFGLYTVTDHIDGELMRASGLSEEGNLYKAINHDANFRLTNADGADKGTLHDGYEKKEGEPEGDFADLDALVDFVATSDDPTFAAQIGERVELADYEKWLIVASYSRADDSAGKNSYHYHDATRSWRVAPWDFNASFGQDWTTRRAGAEPVEFYQWANRLFERLLADPALGPAFRQRYRDALAGPLALDSVLATIDGWAAAIDFGARRDWARWEGAYRSFGRWSDRSDWTSYQEEVQYVRDWLTDRDAALQSALAE
ncbi:MAG TPA: CotH kinase family protein [Kofleriaceae bacterium]|nr:CotH kinase family protein [Kofleriaceae bacterium]